MNNCKYCNQKLPHDFYEQRKKQKAANARAGLMEAKARGKHIGRPITIAHAVVCELRDEGLSLRKIANRLKISKSAVQYILKNRFKGPTND